MTSSDDCRISIRSDRQCAPHGVPIGVLIEIEAPLEEQDDHGEPSSLNLGLAIDRSGSMGGAKMRAAIESAKGIVRSLHDDDHLTITAFDSAVETPISGVGMSDAGRSTSLAAIAQLDARGRTALFDGWRTAAEGVASTIAPSGSSSHVVVLSDGMGNLGLTAPHAMREHAAGLASHGIRTTAVGIGANYLSTQLDALAGGGEGSFHHASEPEEIVEVVMGELGNLRRLSRHGVELSILIPHGLSVQIVGGRTVSRNGNEITIRIGGLASGMPVRVGLLLEQPALPGEHTLDLQIMLRSRLSPEGPASTQRISWCPSDGGSVGQHRDAEVAERVARLWHADLIVRAMDLNEGGRFGDAQHLIDVEQDRFLSFVAGLDCGPELSDTLDRVARRVRDHWHGTRRKEAEIRMRKLAYCDPEHRVARRRVRFSDLLDDKGQ